MALYGGIEGGGTKFICAVGTGPEDIRAEIRIPTTVPGETLGKAIKFFQDQEKIHGRLSAIGFATFGPIDPDPSSKKYGHVLLTPKAGWSNTDVVSPFTESLNLPVGFDTDVNGAALAESQWGAGKGCDPVLYMTVGTGIGGGALVNGKLMHGLLHPEMGHIRIPHDMKSDPFSGSCPIHGDCFEGLASGPAIEQRWHEKAEVMGSDHPAWELESTYLALAVVNFILSISPQKIIIGGGVAQQSQILPMVRKKVIKNLNGYVQSIQVLENIDQYIVNPGLEGRSGVLGAIALAQRALTEG
ncbi:MAG: ROK family protein [Chloroflexota bacterium]